MEPIKDVDLDIHALPESLPKEISKKQSELVKFTQQVFEHPQWIQRHPKEVSELVELLKKIDPNTLSESQKKILDYAKPVFRDEEGQPIGPPEESSFLALSAVPLFAPLLKTRLAHEGVKLGGGSEEAEEARRLIDNALVSERADQFKEAIDSIAPEDVIGQKAVELCYLLAVRSLKYCPESSAKFWKGICSACEEHLSAKHSSLINLKVVFPRNFDSSKFRIKGHSPDEFQSKAHPLTAFLDYCSRLNNKNFKKLLIDALEDSEWRNTSRFLFLMISELYLLERSSLEVEEDGAMGLDIKGLDVESSIEDINPIKLRIRPGDPPFFVSKILLKDFPVFAEALKGSKGKDYTEVLSSLIKNETAALHIRNFLRFGDVNELSNEKNYQVLNEVITFAHAYQIEPLLLVAQEALGKLVNKENVSKFLEMSITSHAPQLFSACINYINHEYKIFLDPNLYQPRKRKGGSAQPGCVIRLQEGREGFREFQIIDHLTEKRILHPTWLSEIQQRKKEFPIVAAENVRQIRRGIQDSATLTCLNPWAPFGSMNRKAIDNFKRHLEHEGQSPTREGLSDLIKSFGEVFEIIDDAILQGESDLKDFGIPYEGTLLSADRFPTHIRNLAGEWVENPQVEVLRANLKNCVDLLLKLAN